MLGSEYSRSSRSSFLVFVLSSGGAADFFSSPSLPSASPLLHLSLASGGGGAQGKRGLGRLGFRGCDAGGFIGARPWLGGARTPMDGRGHSARFVDAWRHRSGARARLGFDARAGEQSPQFVAERRGGRLGKKQQGLLACGPRLS